MVKQMTLDLSNYDELAREAVRYFWRSRANAKIKQEESGKSDQGERAGVTAGKNMDGFISLILDVIQNNGLAHANIHRERAVLTLPGFFRPTKLWDLLVMYRGELIAAIELKSQAGPSFGNNSNNRAEETIGASHDFWTAYRKGAFGKQPEPFVGWLMLVEDAPESRAPVKEKSPHFPVFPEFKDTSYLQRYDLLCQKLIQERLYTTASVVATPATAGDSGAYSDMSQMTGLRAFIASLAGHVAAKAAMTE